MIIHLTSTYTGQGIESNLEYLRAIRDVVHENGSRLARDWLGPVGFKTDKQVQRDEDWPEVVKGNMSAVDQSDILIVEGTEYGFLDGYQVAYALQERKPVLFLMRSNILERAVSGLDNDLMTVVQYDGVSDLKTIVTNFMTKNTLGKDEANLLVDVNQPINRYLNSRKRTGGASSEDILTELLKEAVYEQIDNNRGSVIISS